MSTSSISSAVTEAYPRQKTEKIPFALANFDALPNEADVSIKVVTALYDCSPATVWRAVKSGRIPAPTRHTPGCTRWNVGKLRQARAA
jgi:predicted DNA-binding transcriptional regulator AlpA